MIGTIFSVLLALFLYFTPPPFQLVLSPDMINITMIVVATAMLFALLLTYIGSYSPLLKAEYKLSSRLLEMFSHDRHVKFTTSSLIIFSLLTYVLAMTTLPGDVVDPTLVFCVWVVLFGFTLDRMRSLIGRILCYLNPFEVVEMFTSRAEISIREEHEVDLCHGIDGLAEISVKSVQVLSSSLSKHVIDELENITDKFLSTAKSIVFEIQDAQSKKAGITDRVNYTLSFIFQRLEMIFNSAVEVKNEPLCAHIITVMGKIIISATKYDITIASFPLHYLGKFSKHAMDNQMFDVGERASCTLLEVAKITVKLKFFLLAILIQILKKPFLLKTKHLL